MPQRVTKSKAKKTFEKAKTTLERDSLSSYAELNSCVADMPCTYCFKHKIECRMEDTGRSDRCKECIRRGRSCDGVRVASSCEAFPRVSPGAYANRCFQ